MKSANQFRPLGTRMASCGLAEQEDKRNLDPRTLERHGHFYLGRLADLCCVVRENQTSIPGKSLHLNFFVIAAQFVP